jgi:hypothetical protein
MLIDEIRARNNLDPMAVSQAEIDAAVAAAGVTPANPAEIAPPAGPAVPAIVGGPPAGNETDETPGGA